MNYNKQQQQQQYNEYLFWKVYRNIYLNKLIYEQLLYSEIEYINFQDYSLDNRIKFKDIISLKWMIQKKQFKLLKYKLESNQFITIDKTSILELIKFTPSSNDIKIQNEIFKTKEIYIELFHLIMKRSDYFQDDLKLIESSIIYNRPIILEIILNEPYNLKISKLNLFYAIRLANKNIIDILIKYVEPNILIKSINKNQKDWKFEKFKFRTSFIQFILNNPQIYPIPIPTTQHLTLKEQNKLKSTPTPAAAATTTTSNETNDELNYHLKFQLLELKDIIYIDSFETKNKLLDLDYFINSYNLNQFQICINYIKDRNSSDKITIELLLLYFRIYFKCIHSKTGSFNIPISIQERINEIIKKDQQNNEKTKQLFKLLVIESKSMKLYSIYFYKYYEIINVTGLFSNGFKNSPFNGILLKLNKLVKESSDNGDNGDNGKIQLIEFISNLINNGMIKFNLNPNLIYKIRDIIITCMDSKEWYEKVLKSIIDKHKIKEIGLPNEWSIHLKSIIIEPMKSIEKLEINEMKDIKLLMGNNITKKHFINKIKKELEYNGYGNNISILSKIYHQPLYNNCNIKIIKWSQILNNQIPHTLFEKCDISINDDDEIKWFNNNIKKSKKSSSLEINNNHSNNSIIYYNFKPNLIKAFIWQIVQKMEYSKLLNLKFDTSFIQQFSSQLIKILYKSIINCDINTTTLILNQIDFKSNLNQIKEIWKEPLLNKLPIYKNNVFYLFLEKDKNQQQVIIDYIKFWINYITTTTTNNNDGGKENHDILTNIYELIINYLYLNILRIQGINLKQVNEIKILLNFKIKINHSIFHSIYYSNIKSPKIIRLIKDIYQYIPIDNPISENTTIMNEKIKKLMDPNKFTFEYIFGNNGNNSGIDIDTILKHIMNQSINFVPNRILSSLLVINKIDLFIVLLKDLKNLKKVLNFTSPSDWLVYDICKVFSSLYSSSTISSSYQANMNNFQTIINLIQEISNDSKFHIYLFKVAFHDNRKEIVSYFINHQDYNFKELSKSNIEIWSTDYPIVEHIYINHPNVKFDSNLFENKSPIFQLLNLNKK